MKLGGCVTLPIIQKRNNMTTENLPTIQNNNLMPSQQEFQMLQVIAKNASDSGLYGGFGQQAKIFMVLLAARELGVSPCLALNGGIWNIQGKIEISARLMNGLIRRAGHSIKIVVSNDTHCTLLGTRSDGDSFETSFNMDDAIKAGLAGGNVWKKYPADMLYNRCMSRLARRLFPDIIGTAYVEGEIKEAKEIELKEKEMTQVEYEEIKHNPETLQKILINAPKDIKNNISNVDKIIEDVPKINQEDLTLFLTHYVETTDDFKENFEKFIAKEWNVKDFKNIPSDKHALVMSWIAKNIEMQSMPQGK